jgi:hypothetical protein
MDGFRVAQLGCFITDLGNIRQNLHELFLSARLAMNAIISSETTCLSDAKCLKFSNLQILWYLK